jgi:hypothetical protein
MVCENSFNGAIGGKLTTVKIKIPDEFWLRDEISRSKKNKHYE